MEGEAILDTTGNCPDWDRGKGRAKSAMGSLRDSEGVKQFTWKMRGQLLLRQRTQSRARERQLPDVGQGR